MRILIATDKFKGSLSAGEAGEAIAAGLTGDHEVDFCPIADGGEGFTETMCQALGGRMVKCETVNALLQPVSAEYSVTSNGLAVLEMAAACGLAMIPEELRDPMQSSTYGVGLMIRHAANQPDVERILVGLGGSATNDAGVGMADALGVLFLDAEEEPLPPYPAGLDPLALIDSDQREKLPPIEAACDVENPLLGPNGATAIFGPQKGVLEKDAANLDAIFSRIVEIGGANKLAEQPGAGAAGGLGFGILHFLQGSLHPGFDLVSQALGLRARIESADLVITGEGALDAQSLGGKGPVGVARLANELGTPVAAFAGMISDEVREAGIFSHCGELRQFDLPLETLLSEAAPLLTKLVREQCGLLTGSQGG